MDARPVLDLVAAATSPRPFTLVGIGGRGGAGKSTLARLIPDAQIVGTDEFWDGVGFDLDRLRAEVFDRLLAGEAAAYRSFDWGRGVQGAQREITPAGIVVVEGVCALHRLFRDDYDVRVWVDASYSVRLSRGVARDGEAARKTWVERWMPSEDRYVEQDDPIPSAHIVVDGNGSTAGRS